LAFCVSDSHLPWNSAQVKNRLPLELFHLYHQNPYVDNFKDFLIQICFTDFTLKFSAICHENQIPVRKKGSVADSDFLLHFLVLVTHEKSIQTYRVPSIFHLCPVSGEVWIVISVLFTRNLTRTEPDRNNHFSL